MIYYDPVLPNNTLLGYVNADHWVSHSSFPREILIESVLIFIDEDNVRAIPLIVEAETIYALALTWAGLQST